MTKDWLLQGEKDKLCGAYACWKNHKKLSSKSLLLDCDFISNNIMPLNIWNIWRFISLNQFNPDLSDNPIVNQIDFQFLHRQKIDSTNNTDCCGWNCFISIFYINNKMLSFLICWYHGRIQERFPCFTNRLMRQAYKINVPFPMSFMRRNFRIFCSFTERMDNFSGE